MALREGRNKFRLSALALAHYRNGQFGQTVALLQEAISLPDAIPNNEAAFPLALAYRGLGQEQESRRWYQLGVLELRNAIPPNSSDPAPWEVSHWLGVNVWYREAKAVFEPSEPRTPPGDDTPTDVPAPQRALDERAARLHSWRAT
jgi:hypothetical protein